MASGWFIKWDSKVGGECQLGRQPSLLARSSDKVLSGSFIKCASQVRRKWHADGSKSVLARLMVTVSANWLDNQVC
jgi:hypothetical protein